MKGVSSNQQKLNDTYLEGKVKKKKKPTNIRLKCPLETAHANRSLIFIWLAKVFSRGRQDLDMT